MLQPKFMDEFVVNETLEEDDVVECSDVENFEVEEKQFEFSSNFTFQEEDFQNEANTLDEKISQIRAEQKQKQKKEPKKTKNEESAIPAADGKNEANEDQNQDGENEVNENDGCEIKEMALSSSEEEEKEDTIKVKKKRKKLSELMQLAKKKVINVEEDGIIGEKIVYDPSMSFQQMNLSRPLQRAITTLHFLHPTPVQAATIPIALMGRDIYGCAATGTGKTLAFMLPVLERLLFKPTDKRVTRVLVVLPTRELAHQVYKVSKQLAEFTKIRIAIITGGPHLREEESTLRNSIPDIIIATPGRLIDHLENTPSFSLRYIEILILDEADRLLDPHFAEQMKEIIRQCSYSRQTMLFSATLNDEVKDLAASCLKDPVKIFINSNSEVAMNLREVFIRIRPNREADREAILAALVSRTYQNRVMVFAQTKIQVHRLYILLGLMGIKVAELHGNLNQPQRFESLRKFKEDEVDVLVATDVASRGLDIPGVKTVINFTLPCTLQHYIHRVGRTARAGRSGRSVSMVGEKERKLLREIVKQARNPVKRCIILPEVISKFQSQLTSLEGDLSQVMRQEREEKELQSMEKNVKKVERMVNEKNGVPSIQRSWFQTPAEKKKEKRALKLGDGRKKKKGSKPTTEDRIEVELQKAAQYQARFAKRGFKQQRIRAISEDFEKKSNTKKNPLKRKSFDHELADTSRTAVKKFRYEATHHEKMENLKKIKLKKNQHNKSFKSNSRYRRKK